MEITYRLAEYDDLDDIFQLVERAVKQMEQEEIFQRIMKAYRSL